MIARIISGFGIFGLLVSGALVHLILSPFAFVLAQNLRI